MPIVFLLLPHLCLIRLRLFCYSQTNAYALDGHLLVFSAMRRLMLMPLMGIYGVFCYTQTDAYGQWPSSFPPPTPCAPERLADVPVCCGGMALCSVPLRCQV